MENIGPEKVHKEVRTLLQARNAGAIPVTTETLAIPVQQRYRDALSIVPGKQAHLRVLREDAAGCMDDGPSCWEDRPDTLARVDMPTLYLAYSLVFDSLRDVESDPDEIDGALRDPGFLGRGLKYYLPELLRATGAKAVNADSISGTLVKRFLSCRNVMGVIPSATGPGYFPALTLLDYDVERNTIEFASPYFHRIALLSRRDGILRGKAGEPREDCGGFLTKPSSSRLIRTSILNERNRRAIEAVHAVVTAVERTGNTPLITPRYLISRCPGLEGTLAAASPSARNQMINRLFDKAWELLRTETLLTEAYRNIQIPDAAPTAARLDERFRFLHEGRITGIGQDYD